MTCWNLEHLLCIVCAFMLIGLIIAAILEFHNFIIAANVVGITCMSVLILSVMALLLFV